MFLLLDWKQVLDGSFCSWLEASIGSCSSIAPRSPRSSSSWRTPGRWCSHRPGCCCTLIQGILYLNKNPKSRWGPYRLLHFVFSHSSCVILIIIITASLADPDPDIFSLQMSIGSSFLSFLTCMNPLPTIESLQRWQKKHSLCQASVSKATNLVLPSPPLPEFNCYPSVKVLEVFHHRLATYRTTWKDFPNVLNFSVERPLGKG